MTGLSATDATEIAALKIDCSPSTSILNVCGRHTLSHYGRGSQEP
jgi:hypothetical protein